MNATETVAAVIVTYDSGTTVERAVDALRSGDRPPDEIIVVDNASTDAASRDALARVAAVATVLHLGSNTGFCAANNAGVRAAGPVDHVLFCNPDAYVSPTFLDGALAHLARHPTVGAVGPLLVGLDASGRPDGTIDSAGIGQTRLGRFVDLDQGEPLGHVDPEPRPVLAVCAAAALCRRVALDDVAVADGPFDERFFMYKEDVDLGLRLRRSGWDVVVLPALRVLHQRGLAGGLAAHRNATRSARRRSLANEWRIWRRGTLAPSRRATMLPYLLVKTVLVGAGL